MSQQTTNTLDSVHTRATLRVNYEDQIEFLFWREYQTVSDEEIEISVDELNFEHIDVEYID